MHKPVSLPHPLEKNEETNPMNKKILLASIALLATAAFAKLPTPALTDEAKLKAAEAAAKTAHGNKVADFQLCKSREATAAHYFKTAKAAGKDVKPPTEVPACADPGAFVFPPPAAPATPAVASATPVAPATTTAAAKPAQSVSPAAAVKK
jgi:hypothetical protein